MPSIDVTIASVVSKLRALADSIEARKPAPVIVIIDKGDGVETIVYAPVGKAKEMLETGVESVLDKINSLDGAFILEKPDPSKAN